MRLKASWDDATVQDVRLAKLMEKYDIPTIFYWPVAPNQCNEPNGRTSLTEQQMVSIAKKFEIGSHTVTHPLLTRIPLYKAVGEIIDSREMLQSKFGQGINSFCYPRGYSNPQIQRAVVEAGYTSARSTLVGYIHESENPYFEQTTVHVGCDRKEYGEYNWFEYALVMLAEARKTKDSVFSIFGHSWELEKNDAWEDLEALLKEMVK